ncbi:MAG: hypothetical protein ACHQFW_11875 [Chitinophagales bacterium]
MKRIYLLVVLLFSYVGVMSCDFCNCYLGLDPGYNKNTIGLRANWRTAEWTPPVSGLRLAHNGHGVEGTMGHETLQESFITGELFVKYSPIPKLRVYATLPYAFNTLEYDGVTESRNALSDLSLMAMYQLANTMAHDSAKVRHRLFAGLGVKFPTGKSEGASDVDIPMAHHLYSGTGSTDFLVSASYIGKLRKIGWNLDASYKYNTPSANDYRYGNTLNITPRVFYESKIKSVSLLPHVGAAYEMGDSDEYNDETVDETGGTTMYGSAGVDVYFGSISVTTDFRLPFYHDMGNQMSENQSWLFTSVNFHF